MAQTVLFDPLVPLWMIWALGGAFTLIVALAIWRGLVGWPLRALAGAVVLAALLNPSLQSEERAPLSDIVLVVVDHSASQRISDRADQTGAALAALEVRIAALGMEMRLARVGDGADNAGTLPAIFVASNRTNAAFPTRNVKIIHNTVGGQGILIDGSEESAGNLIKGNRTVGPCYAKDGKYIITNQANAKVEDNQGFDKVDDSPWLGQEARKAAGKKQN
jgi:hypothetical protein